MLSRRRRVTPGSNRINDGDDKNRNDDRIVVVDGNNDKDEINENIAFPSSTETSTSTIGRIEFEVVEKSHVASSFDNYSGSDEPRRWPSCERNVRSTDRVITMINFNQNFRRLSSSRIIENSRRRRRKSASVVVVDDYYDTLDCNDKIYRNSSPITNEPSSIATTIVNQTAINSNGYVDDEDSLNDMSRTGDIEYSIISDRVVDSLTNKTNKICHESNEKVENDYDNETSRKRFRVRKDKIKDFVREHKSSRRRSNVGAAATRNENSWRTKKNHFFIVIGLLMWCMIIPEIAGRQSHHRTCPGCPHQHVHAINRKAGAESGGTEATGGSGTDTSAAAPSPDDLRLEAIKHQILTKLGLRTRPDVNRTLASVPRHLALETLYRAEAQPAGHQDDRHNYHDGGRREHHRHLDNDDDDDDGATSSSSSSAYGQFYYAGEEYSYRNVDPGAIGKDETTGGRDNENKHQTGGSSSYSEKERHRGHGDFRHDDDDDSRHGNDAEQENQVEMDDFYARTSEIITFAEPGRTLNGQPLLEFPRSSGDPALEPLRIKRATLWARVELRHAHHYQHHRRAQSNQRNITLWVFRVRCGNVTHLRGKELGEHLEMVTSLGVNVNQLGWQKFDVTRVVSNWYSGRETSSTRHEKLTLLVDCTGCGSHVHVSTFGVQSPNVVESSLNAKGGEDPDRPFLVVRTDPAAVKRVRRRAIECSGAIKGQCCKQRFYVSFSQLGWDDWIIAPQGYYANYCRGDCAAGHRTPDTFLNYYTHVIEEYRKMDRLAGMQPCCAPLKFSSMSLIYYGPDSNIIKRDLPKMVVDECGCP